jgi:cytochrome b subunit of formate dehydrogenase
MTKLQQIVFFSLLLFIFPIAAFGQTSQDCLACHGDRALTMERAGRTVSLFIDTAKLERSVHGMLSCVQCHKGFDPNEIPHAKVIKPVQCQTCHDASEYSKSIHAVVEKKSVGENKRETEAAACKDCHGTHGILSPSDLQSAVSKGHLPETCGKCHQSDANHFSESAHGVALSQGIQGAPSCINCHGGHNTRPVTDKDSPMYKTNQAKVCLGCHLDNPDVRKRIGPSAGFIASYETSVHGVALAGGNLSAAVCSDCHGGHDVRRPGDPRSLVNKFNIPHTCSKCHADVTKVYDESIHGKAILQGNADAPVCTDCHGEHQILAPTNPRSRVSARNVSVEVCASCHSSVQLTQKYAIAGERFKTFEDSYHGLASREGSTAVANCASCHGYHNIKPSSDPTSTVNKANLAVTCGKCHRGANENFAKGPVHVIVASNGETVLYWIKTFYISLIIVLISAMLIHNLVDFIKKSKVRVAIREGRMRPEIYGPSLYLRMTLDERLQHGVLLVSFFALVITGFMLKFPDAWWVVFIRQLSGKIFDIRSVTHRVAGVVLISASLYHVCYVLFVPRGKQLIRDLVPKIQDVRDVAAVAWYNLGISKTKPKFGRFSYVEKAEYWALVWGVIVMGGTGVIMWFDNFFMGTITKLGWDIAQTVHYYEAWLATLAIFVWHIYYVIFNPNSYPMNLAWWKGTLTEEEMAEEHALELEEMQVTQLTQHAEEEFEEKEDHANAQGSPTPSEVAEEEVRRRTKSQEPEDE